MLGARLATAGALICGLLATLFLLGPAWRAAVFALVVGGAALEWGRLCRLSFLRTYAAALTAGFLLLAWLSAASAALAVGAAFWAVAAPLWLWRGVRAEQGPLLAAAGFVVLLPAALAMVSLPAAEVLLVLGLVWVADTAAYFAGSAWGRHKLAPSISPGKSWEGVAGAAVGVLAYAGACRALVPALSAVDGAAWLPYLGGALVLGGASVVGDLFESAAKRQAGVKDSGSLLPGHGGLLDRMDSATSTLPLAAVLLPLLVAR